MRYRNSLPAAMEAAGDDLAQVIRTAFERQAAGEDVDVDEVIVQAKIVLMGGASHAARCVIEQYEPEEAPTVEEINELILSQRVQALAND